MNADLIKLQESLCKAMCSEVRVVPKNKDLAIIRTPFTFPDGDPYQVYLKELPGGLLRVSGRKRKGRRSETCQVA